LKIDTILKVIDLSKHTEVLAIPLVASVGFFDGVHIGHQHLIGQLKSEANRLGLPSAVITFPVHPRLVLQPDYQFKLLCGYEEKLEKLAEQGIDYCLSLPFTCALSQLSARDFIHQVLKKEMCVHTLLVGYDHRFGHQRESGFFDYQRYGEEMGMNVLLSSELKDNGKPISSSDIRHYIENGQIRKVNQLLTYPYRLSGKIVEGYQVGRSLGFPTANISAWDSNKVMPPNGVYAVKVMIRNCQYKGMLYIGSRPTLNMTNEISIEVHIFDFEGNLYEQCISVEFIDFVRTDGKFENLEELKHQLHQDRKMVEKILQELI